MRNLTRNQILHRQYLKSELWKQKRLEALTHYGCICARCGQHGTDVHHKTYERSGGNEIISDLEIMCRPCHKAHHQAERCSSPHKKRFKKKRKAILQQAIFRLLSSPQKKSLRERFSIANDNELYCKLSHSDILLDIHHVAARMLGNFVCIPFARKSTKR